MARREEMARREAGGRVGLVRHTPSTPLAIDVSMGLIFFGVPYRLSDYLERHHPEILTEFRAIGAATSLEESGSGASEEPAFLS